jgi:aminocarboxymuconate-semialdehyde decarboxylase
MAGRRDLTQSTAGSANGLVFVACGLEAGPPTQARAGRREVVINGKRVKTVDVHAHCAVPETLALMGQELAGPGLRTDLDMATEVDLRIKVMDDQGIDIEALSINPNWYKVADRDLAKKIIQIQNEKLAEACAKNPDRFVAFGSVALQFPDLAAEQLEEGVKLPSAAMSRARRSAIRGSTRSGARPSSWVCSSSFIRRATGHRSSSVIGSKATATSAT